MMTTRKVDKKRPYRVDYFDVSEMQGDKALVCSTVVRVVTAEQAKHAVWNADGVPDPAGRFIVRAYRFYKKLSKQPRFKSYVAIEKLFPGATAVEVMEEIESYRSGTGPNSPATKAVLKDLDGMISNDAHEKAMDSFVPFPQGTPEPMPGISVPESGVPCPNCGLGIDDNGDGDCAVCSSPAYKMAALDPPPPVYSDPTQSLKNAVGYQVDAFTPVPLWRSTPAIVAYIMVLLGMLGVGLHFFGR